MNRRWKWATMVGAGVAAWYAWRGRRRRGMYGSEMTSYDSVNLASDESFPASDPPSYTPTGGLT